MHINQRGAASLDIALAISFSIGGIILLFSLISPLTSWRDALNINQHINAITQAATLSYQHDVMQSRCLSQTGLMNVQRLINEQRLPHDINQGLWQFDVKLTDLAINSWTRPSQIQIKLTFNNQADMQAVIDRLPPNKTDNLTLVFSSPLRIDITDNWAYFNKLTGCYE